MKRANNFNEGQVLDRVVPSPSFKKLLFSDYGDIKLYQDSKALYLLSLLNMVISIVISIVIICVTSMLIYDFMNVYNQKVVNDIIMLSSLILLIIYCFFSLLTFMVGALKKKSKLIQKKISFDGLLSSIIIKIVFVVLLMVLLKPNIELDPLLPTTSSEISRTEFLLILIIILTSALITHLFFHFLILITSLLMKNTIMKQKLHELMIEATSVNNTKLPINLNIQTVEKILFEKIKK